MSKLTAPGVAARLKFTRAASQARALRKSMTPAEKSLWRELRRFPIADSHWRKQVPIGPFVADFVCHQAKLIVDVDGGVHDFPGSIERQHVRDSFLRGRGYCVLRFSNGEVRADIGAFVRVILAAAK